MTAIPSTVDILRRLVAYETLSRRPNLDLLDYVEGLLVPAGARVERFAHADGSRANLWATIGPEGPGGVVLSGHTDVVPVAGQDWSVDPFALTERDGRYYGRGTADMKGFVAAAVHAAIGAARRDLRRPLHLALSYDEEIGCMGVRGMIEALAARPDRPALCIVGEPTGMRIATGHKGKLACRACCHGREGHSALAPNALNALHLGAAFIASLQARQEELVRAGARDPAYDIPFSTIHAGLMQGGTALNIVPNRCEIDFEIRNIVADDPAAILAAIAGDAEAIAAPHRARFPEARIEIETVSGYPGLDAPEDAPAVRLLRRITGQDGPAIKVAFGTEGGLFHQGLGMSTAICGPGFMEQGHKPDEFIAAEQLSACDRMLSRLLDALEAPAA
ncbi:acetylornithine deacetylase (plasmid) [Paracoccus versutus]|uniref:Acetylornithine deacetylase n=1 Tax=Paracoccus versutus TaxID=34007 RepID=A0AAQ0HLD0_PARVE|nr:acetylornithine deacetylase [Paracoccus versutus]KGJ10606.1 acetylornithine deacetylase [Paracoccus versutus]REG54317.1 acetylornithine deacetylase [Paracoccus versutus]WEJ80293.1 acetylornithine deacetylase [Paracoccus versutus]